MGAPDEWGELVRQRYDVEMAIKGTRDSSRDGVGEIVFRRDVNKRRSNITSTGDDFDSSNAVVDFDITTATTLVRSEDTLIVGANQNMNVGDVEDIKEADCKFDGDRFGPENPSISRFPALDPFPSGPAVIANQTDAPTRRGIHPETQVNRITPGDERPSNTRNGETAGPPFEIFKDRAVGVSSLECIGETRNENAQVGEISATVRVDVRDPGQGAIDLHGIELRAGFPGGMGGEEVGDEREIF